MKFHLLIIFTTLLFVSFTLAQTQNPSCPSITVIGPGRIPAQNEVITFTAVLDDKARDMKLEFKWLSNGKILGGQGTNSITVGEWGAFNPTATVQVEGLPEGCPNTASETLIFDPPPEAYAVDRYLKINPGMERVKLDQFFIALQNDPTASGYILLKITKNETISRVKRQISFIKGYVRFRKFDGSRLQYGVCNADLHETSLWIVPLGAESPDVAECKSGKVDINNPAKPKSD